MPGYAASSMVFFTLYGSYIIIKTLFDFEKAKILDASGSIYVGGAEHTVGHLLYAQVLAKISYIAMKTCFPS